jgi:hypothetical protein
VAAVRAAAAVHIVAVRPVPCGRVSAATSAGLVAHTAC